MNEKETCSAHSPQGITPLPWKWHFFTGEGNYGLIGPDNERVSTSCWPLREGESLPPDMAYIVRCVNSHEKLVEALELIYDRSSGEVEDHATHQQTANALVSIRSLAEMTLRSAGVSL